MKETTTKKITPVKVSNHRRFNGEVVGVINKTIQVKVKNVKTHKKYNKQFYTFRKFAVHDEKNVAKLGDLVIFEECRPISKTKKWKLVKVENK